MPVISLHTPRLLLFGEGDIIVTSMRDTISFAESRDKFPVGMNLDFKPERNIDSQVLMQFSKLESVDTVVRSLLRVRGFIVNRHWFEVDS